MLLVVLRPGDVDALLVVAARAVDIVVADIAAQPIAKLRSDQEGGVADMAMPVGRACQILDPGDVARGGGEIRDCLLYTSPSPRD